MDVGKMYFPRSCLLLTAVLCTARVADSVIDMTASVHTDHVIYTTDKRFLSVVIGATVVRHNWATFNMSNPRVQTLAKAFAPAILRLGGNEADLLVFNKSLTSVDSGNDEIREHFEDPLTDFYMTVEQWDRLNQFTRSVGWNLLFDLNVLLRRPDREWDSDNAVQLIQYSIQQNYTDNLSFELGNEPNLFEHYINRTLPPTQLGKDFLQLHYLLRQDPAYQKHFTHSLLVGPDTTRPAYPHDKVMAYMETFLKIAGESLSAITWHQYYMNGPDALVEEFYDPLVLSLFPQQVARVRSVIEAAGLSHKPLMLGETSSCWGGGAPGLSNRYVAGFLWLDKLGIAAQTGHSVVMRQTFYEGKYGLLDEDLNPTPDYWLSLVFKTLVGTQVFNTSVSDHSGRTRVYAHCTNTDRSTYIPGSVTVFALNLNIESVNLTFGPELSAQLKHVYWLTPEDGLSSMIVLVNGKEMWMPTDTSLPSISPEVVSTPGVLLPPTSFGFVVFPHANVTSCM